MAMSNMATAKIELGQLGENLACAYLQEKGYKIVERNFRQKWGELDIIGQAPDKTLVFAEVKTMLYAEENKEAPGASLLPEDQLTKAKFLKLSKTASGYAGRNPQMINDEAGWQIDLIAINIKKDVFGFLPNTDSASYKNLVSGRDFFVSHYRNIFF